MYKMTDKWIEACAEGPPEEGDELAEGVQQMAQELLDRRANESRWSIELGSLRQSLAQLDDEYFKLMKRLASAEKACSAATKGCELTLEAGAALWEWQKEYGGVE